MESDLFVLDISPPHLPDLDLQSLFTDQPFILEALNPDHDPDPIQPRYETSFPTSLSPRSLKMDTLSFDNLLSVGVKQENLNPSTLQTCFIDELGEIQRSLSNNSIDSGNFFQPQFSSLSDVPNQLTHQNAGFGFPNGPMRRVYSTGDLSQIHEIQRSQSPASPLSSEVFSTSFDESRFKVSRYSAEQREQRIHRYRSKRTQRNFNKKIKYECRKTLADSRNRIRGRFAKNDETGEISKARDEDDDEMDEMHAIEGAFVMGNKHGGFSTLNEVPICPKYQYFNY